MAQRDKKKLISVELLLQVSKFLPFVITSNVLNKLAQMVLPTVLPEENVVSCFSFSFKGIEIGFNGMGEGEIREEIYYRTHQ